jgi:hypothetical protein
MIALRPFLMSLSILMIIALPCLGTMKEQYKTTSKPDKWDDADYWSVYGGKNPALDDTNGDNKPDDWLLTNGSYVPGSVTLGKYSGPPNTPPTLEQRVANAVDYNNQKTVVIRIKGMSDGAQLSVKSIATNNIVGGLIDYPDGLTPGGAFRERWLTLKHKYQPNEERIQIQQLSKDGIMVLDEVEIKTKCQEKAKSNSKNNAPQAQHSNSSQVSYDPTSGTLSFGDAGIDILNLNGLNMMDPAFANDPILGATISFTGFTLANQEGGGYYFEDGSLVVSKAGTTYFQADVPWLFVDDDARAEFGDNLFGELSQIQADLDLGSAWLQEYVDFFTNTPYWAEFRANTVGNLEAAVANNVPLLTEASVDLAFCTPEPATALALTWGAVFALSRSRRRCRRQVSRRC